MIVLTLVAPSRREGAAVAVALPISAQMRPQTQHWVRLDVIVENFSGRFADVNALKGHVKMEEWVGPNGDSAAVNLHPRSAERGPALRCHLGI
jgi:hypothetical protein